MRGAAGRATSPCPATTWSRRRWGWRRACRSRSVWTEANVTASELHRRPAAVADLTVARRFFVRAGLGLPVYAVRTTRDGVKSEQWRPALSAALGGGAWF